jgi:hypothetical protein
MKEFKATVKEVTPLVDADMGEALGELKYVSVTFAIGALRRILGRLSEPNSKSRKSSPVVMRGCNGPTTRPVAGWGYLVRNGVFTASLLESPQLVEGARFPVKVSTSPMRRID